MVMEEQLPVIRCSICHKSENEVRALIVATAVWLCDECVGIEILEEDTLKDRSVSARTLTNMETLRLIDTLHDEIRNQSGEFGPPDALESIKTFRLTAQDPLQDLSLYFNFVWGLRERLRPRA